MRSLQLLLLCTFIIVLFQSNKGGRNEATTGAPFESNKNACASCHSGGSFTPEIKFTLKNSDGNLVNEYFANEIYNLEFNISATTGNPKYYGFQAVIVDGNNKTAGKITQNGQNVRNLTIQSKSYLTHTTAREDGTFTALWQAPENIGDLKVYVAGIAANGNSNTNGDKAVKSEFQIPQSTVSSYINVEINKPKIMCNVGCDRLDFSLEISNPIIFDTSGKVIINSKNKVNTIDISNLRNGVFYINFEHEGKQFTDSFIK